MYRIKNILEAPSNGASGGRMILTQGTHYVPFIVDTFSSEKGYHILIVGGKGGTGDVEVSVEQAISPEQTTWTEVLAAANMGTDQASILDTELVRTIPIPTTNCYQPHARLKIVVPASCVAVLHEVLVTGGTE